MSAEYAAAAVPKDLEETVQKDYLSGIGGNFSRSNTSNSRKLLRKSQQEKTCASRAAVLNKLLSSEEYFKFQRNVLPWKQRHRWDCGVACVTMCLPPSDRQQLYNELNFLRKHYGFEKTTWTIDLCFLLHHYNVLFRFVTSYAGVNPLLKVHHFYRSSADRDAKRVQQAFKDAETKDIRVSLRRIYLEEILEHVFLSGPVITLGHYVLVIGFDLKNEWIFYNDPTYGDRTCKVTIEDFDVARQSAGTDWDVILVNSPVDDSNEKDVAAGENYIL